MASSYKQMKEDFVSNLSGGTISEINVVTSVAPAAYFLWSMLQARHGMFTVPSLPSMMIDFLLNVGSILLVTTLYSSMASTLLLSILGTASLIWMLPRTIAPNAHLKVKTRAKPIPSKADGANEIPEDDLLNEFPERPFLTAYRGAMLIVTAMAILAVDFHVFPRRFAKVETWGTSLMDVGVGSFVFSAGVVAAKTSLKARMTHNQAGSGRNVMLIVLQRVLHGLRQAAPLVVLGLIRLFSVKGLDYAEHVTEYGIHWNFFFTMSLLPVAMAFIEPIVARLPRRLPSYAAIGLLIAFSHTIALESTSFKAWALSAPRTNLLNSNREGITSFAGYLSIFLMGMEAGTYLLPRHPTKMSIASVPISRTLPLDRPRAYRHDLLVKLFASSALYALIVYVLITPISGARPFSSPISRRLANAPYSIWIASFNTAQIFLCCLVETICFPSVHLARTVHEEAAAVRFATSDMLRAWNASGLLGFLVANLGTGIVNMTVNTLRTNDWESVGIVCVYLVITTAFVKFTYSQGIKLKL